MTNTVITWLKQRRQRLRKVGLILAVAIFGSGFVLAINHLPKESLEFRLELILAYAFFLPPITYLFQSIELTLNARAVDVRLPRRTAAEIVLYANAATYLPIPGGLLTRTAALKAHGVSLARSGSVVLLFTGLAGTVSFAYAGFWTLGRDHSFGWAALMIATVGAISCIIIAIRAQVRAMIVAWEVLLRIVTTFYESACLVLIFAAIGSTVSFSQVAVLVISGFIAMALTIFPSGFGVREGIVALLSPLVGIDPATGFVAAATARIIAMAWMAILALGIALWKGGD